MTESCAGDILDALTKLRLHAARLPDVTETLSYGNPAFKRGRKVFLVLDRYRGVSCMWLRVDPARRGECLNIKDWFASPYDPRQEALCCELAKIDWSTIGAEIDASYYLAGHWRPRAQLPAN